MERVGKYQKVFSYDIEYATIVILGIRGAFYKMDVIQAFE